MKIKFKQLHGAILSAFFALMLVIATVVTADAAFTQIRIDGWDIMRVHFEHPENNNSRGWAGEITVSLYDDILGWGDPQSAFCMDINTDISQNTYDIESFLQPSPIEIAWLMDTYSPTSTTVQGAALQSSIWEVLYGNDFTLTGPSKVENLYNDYMDALEHATIDTNYLLSNYSIVNIDSYQNFLVQNSSSAPVPEPATILLFGAGLIGLIGGAGRKKYKKH